MILFQFLSIAVLVIGASSTNSDRYLRRQAQEATTSSDFHYSIQGYELLITPGKELHATATFSRAGYQVITLWDGDCKGDSPVNMTIPDRADVLVTSSGAEGLANETVSFAINNITDYQRSNSDKNFLVPATSSSNSNICIEMKTIGKDSATGEDDRVTFVFNIPMQQSSSTLHAYQGVVLGIITALAAVLLIVACKQRTKTHHVHPDVPEVHTEFNKKIEETRDQEY